MYLLLKWLFYRPKVFASTDTKHKMKAGGKLETRYQFLQMNLKTVPPFFSPIAVNTLQFNIQASSVVNVSEWNCAREEIPQRLLTKHVRGESTRTQIR
jgi:hypothetical protein